jgi:hypothetical protein
MGCWNETCGITQMPIEHGDKIRMFLIVDSKHWNDSGVLHYSTDLWKPFGLSLKGTYDEYGRIENIEEDAISDLLLASIKKVIVEVPNRMGEIFKREELDWETVIEFLTDEGLKITDPHHMPFIDKRLNAILQSMKEKFPDLPDNGWSSERSDLADEQKKAVAEDSNIIRMYHVMVHEDIYQALINYKVPAVRFSSWTEGNLRAELELGAKQFVAEVRADIVDTSKLSKDEMMLHHLNKFMRKSETQNRFVSAANHLNGNYGSGQYLSKYLDFIEERVAGGAADDDVVIKSLVDQFIDFVCFNQAMTLLRKMWSPQCGKGGQDREFVLHKFLGETIAAFSDKKMKAWDEEYGEHDIDEDNHGDQEEQISTQET